MRRIVVRVDPAPDGGWTVAVRAAGADADLVVPYRMAATVVDGRRVPALPPDRPVPSDAPHAPLCRGDANEIGPLLRRLVRRNTRSDDVSAYGRWLHACLLGPAWDAIVAHPEVGAHRAVELALHWRADAADLHRMIWEAMRDDRAPLAGHPDLTVAITRLVPADATSPAPIAGVPSVLFATSVALTDPTIRPGAMYMGLLRQLDAAGHCRTRAVSGVSADDLEAAVRQWRPDLVHLVAHGVLLDGGRGALMLRGENGAERETDAVGLVAALSADGHRPAAVVLSACNTASPGGAADPTDATPLAAQLVAGGIPVVSAMSGDVREPACRLYTRRLAVALHDGESVVVASAHGRRAALVASAAPSADIDWALPALFLAEPVDPLRPLVDARRADELTRLADQLKLRPEPVFIGRADILARADLALRPAGRTGVIAVQAKGTTSGLGGTRLLREVGWRALRDGHLPLLLGPYPEGRPVPPVHARGLVHAVLAAVVTLTDKMDLTPFVPATLADDLGRAAADALRAEVQDEGPNTARATIHRHLNDYRERTAELIPQAVRGLLADDLAQLARRAAAAWGDPFGEHTSVVLLCDDVHRWAAPPLSGHGFLRDLLDDPVVGLGGNRRPAPVVFTTSSTEADGKAVAAWCEQARSGLRVYELKDFGEEEREVGYQWVLLHPWTTKPEEDRELFGAVYTANAGHVPQWERLLRRLPGRPVVVEERLYLAADDALVLESARRDDDEHAWTSYVDRHPWYRL